MSENVNFIQGSKENYNPSEMQGGIYFSKDSREILLNGESYGNATPADEEDITAESGNLKLRDRAYDADNFSGKGYKILRKNIVDGKNVLTLDMLSSNTIHEIRYDFDLDGEELNLGAWANGASLNFIGGSLKNGSLKFNGNSEILGSPRFDTVIFSGQSLQYNPSIFGRKFNLLWFKKNNIGNDYIDFNEAWDNFLYSLGDWKLANHNYIEIIVPSSKRYKVTRGFYVPNWVSIDFCGSELIVDEDSDASSSYVVRINTDPDSFDLGQTKWVYSYPRPLGYFKNLRLTGDISKGILALDNRVFENITVITTETNPDEFVIFDLYPEAGNENIYLDQTKIFRLAGQMPNDSNDNYLYGWVKLGTGDAGIFNLINSCRLFIFNRQGFSLNGGIQCYPYVVYSIGSFQNMHNEFPCSINIIDSKVSFENCIFYRKKDINNVNIINIYENNTLPPFDVLGSSPEVVNGQIPELSLTNCIFAYNYRFRVNNYNYYDIELNAKLTGLIIPVRINNSYVVSYGYGSQNTIHYRLRTHVKENGVLDMLYEMPQLDTTLRNLIIVKLNPDTRQLDSMDGATLQSGQEYTYYTVWSYGNRNKLFRSLGIKYIPTSNWALFTIKYAGCSYNNYLIRLSGNTYEIAELSFIPSDKDGYSESYTMDYGEYLNNRLKWLEYSEELFNLLVEVTYSENVTSAWKYNYIQDSFKYCSQYSLDSLRDTILQISTIMNLDDNDIVMCNNHESHLIYRFKNGLIVEPSSGWALIE